MGGAQVEMGGAGGHALFGKTQMVLGAIDAMPYTETSSDTLAPRLVSVKLARSKDGNPEKRR